MILGIVASSRSKIPENEILRDPSFDDAAEWITIAESEVTGGECIVDASGNYTIFLTQNLHSFTTVSYTVELNCIVNSGGFNVSINGGGAGTNLGPSITTSGFYTFAVTPTQARTSIHVLITDQGSFDGSIQDMSVVLTNP